MNLTAATAVYAGTTEAQAVYYGPHLLWNVLGWEPPDFSPASISGLRLWLDSSVGLYDATSGGNLVTTNSAAVRRWEDRSGNGVHATGGSSTSPTLATAQVNNLAALSFSGSGFFDIPNPLASGGTGASLFVVVRPSMTGTDSGPLVGMIGNNTSEYWRDSHYPYQNTKIEDGFAATTRKTITAPAGLGNWHLYTVISQNSNWRYFFNGSVHFSTTSNTYNGDNFSGRTPQIGRSSIQGTWLYRGWIAEIVIYGTALSETDRLAVSEYLRAKYTLY